MMIENIKRGKYFRIGKGNVSKSMVLAQDIVKLISNLGSLNSGVYNLTDDVDPTFEQLENAIAQKYNKRIISIPYFAAYIIAIFGSILNSVSSRKLFPLDIVTLKKMTKPLTFSCAKAKRDLNWKPNSILSFFE
jgi:nucleoside-diphosphate-sugar epimerase